MVVTGFFAQCTRSSSSNVLEQYPLPAQTSFVHFMSHNTHKPPHNFSPFYYYSLSTACSCARESKWLAEYGRQYQTLTLTVPVTAIDALRHFETG